MSGTLIAIALFVFYCAYIVFSLGRHVSKSKQDKDKDCAREAMVLRPRS